MVAVAGLFTSLVTALSPNAAQAAVACGVAYTTSDWGTGFTANLTITNNGDPLTNWTLKFTFSGNQQITQGWSANWTQSGANVTATNMSWNGNLSTGATANIGFNANYSGTNSKPTSFTINGVACNGGSSPTPTVIRIEVPPNGNCCTLPAARAMKGRMATAPRNTAPGRVILVRM